MFLRTVHPGVAAGEVVRDVPWELRTAEDVGAGPVTVTPPPTDEVLGLIRRFDPEGFWTG